MHQILFHFQRILLLQLSQLLLLDFLLVLFNFILHLLDLQLILACLASDFVLGLSDLLDADALSGVGCQESGVFCVLFWHNVQDVIVATRAGAFEAVEAGAGGLPDLGLLRGFVFVPLFLFSLRLLFLPLLPLLSDQSMPLYLRESGVERSRARRLGTSEPLVGLLLRL